jgi:cytochrome P450
MSDERATTSPSVRPGGPRGLRGQMAFMAFGRDPLGFVERLARDFPGGAARLPMPGTALVYLTEPEAIGAVLLDRERVFIKDWTTRSLGPVLGNGLFTSEGDFWRRQRGLVAPALHRKQIGAYVEIAARRAAAYVASLRDGEVRDVKPDMTRLTMEVVAEALFGADLGDAATRVARALEQALGAFESLIYTWRRFVPAAWDQPVRRRLRDASAALDAVVVEIIRKKREAGAGGDHASPDLLSRLLAARDEGGAGMTDQQVRDEVVTMLLAGHETTAMALSFALWFLATAPGAAASIAAEAAGGGGPIAETEDVARLVTAAAAFRETLRLRPPIWLFGREATRDTVVGRFRIERGEQVLVTPWLMHHDARWFPEPGAFRPERWTDAFEEALPRHVYLPFGGGLRTCAGLHFALMEGAVVLATICRAMTVERADDGDLELSPAITLRPRAGVRLRFRARSAPSGQ